MPEVRRLSKTVLILKSCAIYLQMIFFCLAISLSINADDAFAQGPGPGWINAHGEAVTPEEADAYYQSTQVFHEQDAMLAATDAAAASDEITALARALQHDPKLIFEYVHNHIDYVPYYGSLKGATLTYLDGSGNDFDQASLMIALLRAGTTCTAQYVYGTMTIPLQNMGNWLGVDANPDVISTVLSNGGIPHSRSSSSFYVSRVWVKVQISNTVYYFDPAFKVYEEIQGVDLKSAMGFNHDALLTAAGGSQGANGGITGLSESVLNAALNSYTSALVTDLRTNHANASMEEIIGGHKIVEEHLGALPTSLAFATSAQYTWTDIPQSYAHTVTIQHGGINKTLNTADLAGRRLSIVYSSEQSAGSSASVASVAQDAGFFRQDLSPSGVTSLPTATGNITAPIVGQQTPDFEVQSSGSWDFGKIYSTGYSEISTTLSNPNSVAIELTVSLINNGSGAFSFIEGGGAYTIAAGASHSVKVRLSSSGQSAGQKTATLRLQWSYGGSQFADDYISLTGAVAQAMNLGGYGMSASSYLNTPIEGSCRITNNGSLPLTINSTSITGADAARFEIVSGGGAATVPAGSSRDIQVRYLANAVGTHTASVHMTLTYDDLPYEGDVLGLSGETLNFPAAHLLFDDVDIAHETTSTGAVEDQPLTLIIDHPYAGSSGTFCDETISDYTLKRGATYAIVYDFGGRRMDRILEKRRGLMAAYKRAGKADDSREALTESLNMIGMTWMRAVTLNDELLARIAGVMYVAHHRFGIVAQESGYYIDVKAQTMSVSSRHTDNSEAREAFFKAGGYLASAMEHGIIEQMQTGSTAVSTAKLLQIANADGVEVFFATSSNFDAISSHLTGYSEQDLTLLRSKVSDGNTFLILPANGQLTLGDWSGKAYISYFSDGSDMSQGMIIGGDYNGGYSAFMSYIQQDLAIHQVDNFLANPATDLTLPSQDPVDMVTGAFLNESSDLALGGGAGGLGFKRSYNSSNTNTKGPMGRGWTHNLNLHAEEYSSLEYGLGLRRPEDAAALLTASVAVLDLMEEDATMSNYNRLKAWMTAALTGKWAMDRLTGNAVNIYLEGDALTFLLLPDGSYTQPPGVTSKLVKVNGPYRVEERTGGVVEFNSSGQVSRRVDGDGNAVAFTYSDGKLQSVADGFGHALTLTYSGDLVTSVADSTGRSVSFAYDAANDLTTFTDAGGEAWHYAYDADGRMLTMKNPLGITTVTNVYDGLGRVASQTVPRQQGSSTYGLYFSEYRNVEEDGAGGQRVHFFDDRRRLVATEDALGNKTTRSYDGQNHVVAMTDPRGFTTTYTYDGNNNLAGIEDALGNESANSFDALFRLTTATDPLGHAVSYAYGDSSHPYSVTAVSASPYSGKTITTGFTYYGNGLKKTSTDGKGCATTFTYDSYGNPDTAKTAAHTAIDYGYNARGEMTSLTDQKGSTTTFAYDNRGLPTSKTDPNEQTSTFTYNGDGSPHTATDRKGRTTTFTYTPSGKLATTTYAGGSTVTLGYDSLDRLTSMTDALGTTSYTYDAAGRLVSTTDAQGVAIAYTYDAAGNVTKITYPGNKSVSYTYDALNRLKTAKIDFIASTPTATYTYDAAGRMTGLTQFNGTTATYGYDNTNRLTGLQNRTGGGTTLAGYSFTLDDNGNRTTSTVSSALTFYPATQFVDYGYSDAGNRLTRIGAGTSLEYDAEGQLSKKGSITCTFDDAHRMTATSSGSSTFYYDGANRRLKAVRNGVTRRYIHDALGNLLAEADGSGVILRYFIYGKGLLAAVDASTGALYCYHFDATGNTVAMTNASQVVVNQYAYTPFGEIAAKSETWAQPFTYVGQYGVFQESDNLYYMRARYYDASVGRFVSEDPAGFDGGDVNLYAYVSGNPIMFIDPLGLCGTLAGAGAYVMIGNTDYQWWDSHPEIAGRSGQYLGGCFSNKCNVFVYDTLSDAGCAPGRDSNGVIPVTSTWDNPKSTIPGYKVLPEGSSPQIGDVVSYHGHMGIFYPLSNGSKGTISASAITQSIVHNDWGFRRGDSPTIWRYQKQ